MLLQLDKELRTIQNRATYLHILAIYNSDINYLKKINTELQVLKCRAKIIVIQMFMLENILCRLAS